LLLAASLATRACRFSSGVHMTSSNWNTNCTRMRPSRMKSVRADNDFSLAPLKPDSPAGEFINYILTAEPQLFNSAVDEQLTRIANEVEAEDSAKVEGSGSNMVLFQRINEVKRMQRRRALEDLMYASILHKFVTLGVDLLPQLDGLTEVGGANYKALTEGVHSVEALELVKQHLNTILGAAPASYSNVMIKISKLQAAQVYAASVMFGYFLRRVDRRFSLEKAVGTLPKSQEETLKTLEAMFNTAEAPSVNPDYPDMHSQGSSAAGVSLRQYVEQFDQSTLSETARIVSMEGVTLVERHTAALFGSIESLSKQMQEAMGPEPIESPQELIAKIKEVVDSDKVACLKLTYGTQRRIILEAVAFGSFLRDVETNVDNVHGLLTPVSSVTPPPMLES